MVRMRPPVVTLLAVPLLLGQCTRSPQVAVIAMHGLPADSRYLRAAADSFFSGPHPVRVDVFDSGEASDAYREALELAKQVAQTPGLVAVVGHRDSRSTLVVGPVYRDAGIPLVVPNATSRSIADLGPMVFRMVADDEEEGAFLAHMAVTEMGGKHISVFNLSDEYGVGLHDGILNGLKQEGVLPESVTGYGLQRQVCPADFQALVDASLLQGLPDVVILGSRTPDAACIARLITARAPGARFLAADGVEPGPGLLAPAGSAADRVWVVQFWSRWQDSASAAFARDYERRSGEAPDQGTALRWDAVRLLAQAVAEVGPDPRRIASYLRSLGRSRPPYHGITGDVTFGPHQHRLLVVDARGRLVRPTR
jgi:branched-chain amino acid transport system substrate-binding protein